MTVKIHINGKIELELTPENGIEQAVLREMGDSAEKGQSVTFVRSDALDGHCIVSVGK